MIDEYDRTEIVRKILDIIKPQYSAEEVNSAMKSWWINIRSNGGYGLTPIGDHCFQIAGIEFYKFISEASSLRMSAPAFAAMIDRKLRAPYRLQYYKKYLELKVYDGRMAVMLSLYDSLPSYLASLEDRK